MNGNPREERESALMRLAQAVSDGSAVDWEDEETTRPDLRSVLESLRALEGVAQGHRSLEAAEDPIPKRWGPLEIRDRIGRGGFGEVYRAYDPALQAEVALKLRWRSEAGEDARHILDEARKLAKVRHPNVLVVHGADEHDGRVGIWTDLLRGQTLEEMLAAQGPLSAEEAAHVGTQVCRALAAVHAAGLVHCDVKTMNVMRAERGQYILMDFGSVEDTAGLRGDSVTGAPRGTPITMAPEQLRGGPVGPAVDIWGLGVLLYRLVSGRYPIEARSFAELLGKHQRHQLVPLRDVRPDVPAGFARVVERALDFDPTHRYATPGAMEHALLSAVGGDTGRVADPWPEWLRRAAIPLAAAALLAVLTLGLLALHGIDDRWPWERRPLPSPAVPVAPTQLTATAQIYREEKSGAKLLIPNAVIRPGDNLFLTILGTDSMYVYVLDQDDQGHAYVLFPGPSFDLKGALAPGVAHRLPGTHDGAPVTWQVSSAGGRETITVIASRHPRPEIEQDIASIPKASLGTPVAFGAVGPRTLEVLRGIGGLAHPAPPQAPPAASLQSAIGHAQSAGIDARDVWTWQIDLMNPAP